MKAQDLLAKAIRAAVSAKVLLDNWGCEWSVQSGLPTPRIGGMGIVAGLIAAEGVMAPITE